MNIAITGSTGLVGTAVIDYFQSLGGHKIYRLVRPQTKTDDTIPEIQWDYNKEQINKEKLEGMDVIIHLAGANIAGTKWTPKYKQEILNSRTKSTSFLAETIASLENPPKVFLCASAIGYYGHHPAEVSIDEDSPKGNGYLPDVCDEWEKAAQPVVDKGIRTVFMRIGTVLSHKGGALAKMLPIFNLGAGGKLADGKQVYSWIVLEEMPHIMLHLINSNTLSGPVNLTAPHPVQNDEFTKEFGKAIKRPTFAPVPSFGLRLLYGEMADDLLLNGARILPKRLEESGYKFKYPYIKEGFAAALKK